MPVKSLILLPLYSLVFLSCGKWDLDRERFLEVVTIGATPAFTTATLAGQIVGLRSGVVEEYGFLYSEKEAGDPTIETPGVTQLKVGETIDQEVFFSANVSGLRINTGYLYRAYILFKGAAFYGEVDTFQTGQVSLNVLQSECISQDAVSITAEIVGLGSTVAVTEVGYVLSNTNEFPVLERDEKEIATNLSDGRFSVSLSVVENQLYFIRPYLIPEGLEPIYSNDVFSFSTTVGGDWIRRADFPGEVRQSALSFSIGDKGYYGFGERPADGCDLTENDFWEFDPVSGWSQLPFQGSNVEKRSRAAGFAVGGKGYVGLGCNCNNLFADFYEFDPQLNSWLRLANSPLGFRINTIAFATMDKGFIGGGFLLPPDCIDDCTPNQCGTGEVRDDYYQFDPITATWSIQDAWDQDQFGDVIDPDNVFSIGSKTFLHFVDINLNTVKASWEFDPDAGWKPIPPFAGDVRDGSIAFVIGNKGYMGLGGSFSNLKADVYEFDPQDKDHPWRRVADFPGSGRQQAVSFSTKGRGFVGLGFGEGSFKKDLWEYIPQLCTE